jgi:hypothetical protein
MDLNGNVVDRVAQLPTMLGDGAWNATNNTMYAVYLKHIYTVNLRTGELNTFATSENGNFLTIACNADGQLYTVMGNGNLYTVNATTGGLTLVGATGYSPWYAESMQFEPITGNLYWSCSEDVYGDSDHFMQVDTTTGVATVLQASTGETTGLCFPQLLPELAFAMPANDTTVNCELVLVRDMVQQMTVNVGDAAEGADYRIRVKKNGDGKWELADMSVQDLLGLITVHDGIEDKNLTFYGNDAVCTVSIFAVDDQGQPTGTAIAFADLTPGRYVAFATAKEGTIYDGRTLPSNVFKLFVGYEVEVGAESFATFYKDEKLTVEESSTTGELYTISSVSADEAVLSAQIGVAPANTPLLVYNSGSEKKTILLIPTDDQADNVTAYGGFKGTLVASTIAASTNDQTNYALNGKQFVWVKNALSIAANKCWLEVVNSNARAISILFTGETTGIATATRTEATGDLYDLNGRKVLNPTRKGIYIQNGKKVVVK